MHKKVINVSLPWHCSFLKRRVQIKTNMTVPSLVIFHFSTFFPFNYAAKSFNPNILQKLKEINIDTVGAFLL